MGSEQPDIAMEDGEVLENDVVSPSRSEEEPVSKRHRSHGGGHEKKDREGEHRSSREKEKEREYKRRERERSKERHSPSRDRGRDRERHRERDRRSREGDGKSRGRKDDRSSDRDRGSSGDNKHDRGRSSRGSGRDKDEDRHSRSQSKRSRRSTSPERKHGDMERYSSRRKEYHENLEDEREYAKRVEQQLNKIAGSIEDNDDHRIEEQRRRRAEMLAKLKAKHNIASSTSPQGRLEATVSEQTNTYTTGHGDKVANDAPEVRNGSSFTAVSSSKPQTAVSATNNNAEEEMDMFSEAFLAESPPRENMVVNISSNGDENIHLTENWDDHEGYYRVRPGEVLDKKYVIQRASGRGVFSCVAICKELGGEEEVAVKIIRANDTMYRAGLKELAAVKKLADADPENKRHCIRLHSSFEYRGHLCLVFEKMHLNLREILNKYGRNVGIKIRAVQTYAKQMLLALKHMQHCRLLHADIKPDNMLVNESKSMMRMADFGSAFPIDEVTVTPLLVSRFYRAPEIILGLQYDYKIDLWAAAVSLYELYAGHILFPGRSNNDMLRLMMELKGPFPKKMLKRGEYTDEHFDDRLNFLFEDEDPVTKKPMVRTLTFVRPKRDLQSMLFPPGTKIAAADFKLLQKFNLFLDQCLELDPARRPPIKELLHHPFITDK